MTKSYRPSNGTEGMIFMDRFCDRCQGDINEDCEILLRTMAFYAAEEGYPEEWVYQEGKPICTAFEPLAPKPEPKERMGGRRPLPGQLGLFS